MTRTYECMILIDNDAVRAGWKDTKSTIAGLVQKHGGSVVTARRWAERRLAYPIRHKNRATYLLAYLDLVPSRIADLRRDLDISETCLRYLILEAETVPDEERKLSAEEEAGDFVVPEPPADDAVDEPEPPAEASEAQAEGEKQVEQKTEGDAADGDDETSKKDAGAKPEPVTASEGEEA